MKVPNALYLGVPRCASTWLSAHLGDHVDVFVPTVKDLYYFDRHFDRGIEWYSRFFESAEHQSIRFEFSHDYLFSPAAPRRVREALGAPRLVLGLREPVSYVRSTMANIRRHGPSQATTSAMIESGRLLGSAFFDAFLPPWLDEFDRTAFCVFRHDEVVADPRSVYERILGHLDLAPDLPADLDMVVNGAVVPRSAPVAAAGKLAARAARQVRAEPLLGRLKSSSTLQRVMYRQPDLDRPERIDGDDESLKSLFRPSVKRLSELLDIDFVEPWGYA